MGILLFAAILTQVVFALISRPLGALAALFCGLLLLVNQLTLGIGKAGLSFFGLLPLPGLLVAIAAFLWMAAGGLLLWQYLSGKTARRELAAELAAAFRSNGTIYLMVLGLIGLMFVIVWPLVTLVQHQPVLFRVVSLLFILGIVVFLLVRKYRNMEQLDVADTRKGLSRHPLLFRFLFAAVFRPLLIIIICLAYLYVLYAALFSPLVATLAFVLLTGALTFFTRKIKASLQPGP